MVPDASDGQALRGVVMNITVLRWIRRACNIKICKHELKSDYLF